MEGIFKLSFSDPFYELILWVFPVKLVSCECHKKHSWKVNISGNGLVPSGARHQALTWANGDLDMCRHAYGVTIPQLMSLNKAWTLRSTRSTYVLTAFKREWSSVRSMYGLYFMNCVWIYSELGRVQILVSVQSHYCIFGVVLYKWYVISNAL